MTGKDRNALRELAGVVASVLVLLVQAGAAQIVEADTLLVACSDATSAPRVVRSPVLSSPAYASYVEVRAAWRTSDNGRSCGVTASLFVKPAGEGSFSLSYRKSPTEEELGQGLRMIDWSPDGRMLALEGSWWQPNSDVAGRSVLLYDANRKTIREIDLEKPLSSALGRSCSVRLGAVRGFTQGGQVVVDVDDYVDSYAKSTSSKCFSQTSRWAVSANGERARPLVKTDTIKRFSLGRHKRTTIE